MRKKKQVKNLKKKENNSNLNLNSEQLNLISEMLKEKLLDEFSKYKKENLKFEFKTFNSNYYDEDIAEEVVSPIIDPNELYNLINNPKECPICGSQIKKFGTYSLEFGSNIRKNANFCGIDCLKEFIDELSYTKGF